MYKLMYEGTMRKVFLFNWTIIEPDEENNYLQTNLNIKNLKVEKARENEILKKQYNDFLDVKEKMQASQSRQVLWKWRNSY